ncbi:hypothetical protein PHMEG_00017111 [Phytophthora megakarya]|uniref:Uncharacterized protein n=1 Tax=Phytophthora megakarya TaxID=4795 RepID=A0A225VYP4_9STRA|nr:hypothetical protein PHMEG_00017111 [Phytophthora megakarya]
MLKLHLIYKHPQESLNRTVVLFCRQHGVKGIGARQSPLQLAFAIEDDRQATRRRRSTKCIFSPFESVGGTIFPTPHKHGPLRHFALINTLSDSKTWHQRRVCSNFGSNLSVLENTALSQSRSGALLNANVVLPDGEEFSVSGDMVSTQRASLAGDSVDMCIFLNGNPDFVNSLQCEEIPRGQHRIYKPSNLLFDIDPDLYMDAFNFDKLAEFVTSVSISRELNGD